MNSGAFDGLNAAGCAIIYQPEVDGGPSDALLKMVRDQNKDVVDLHLVNISPRGAQEIFSTLFPASRGIDPSPLPFDRCRSAPLTSPMTTEIVLVPSRPTRLLVAAFLVLACFVHGSEPPARALRLYVFDNGTLVGGDPARFGMTRETVSAIDMVAVSYLIVHPKGTLQWDSGVIPDEEIKGGQQRFDRKTYIAVVTKSLESQLAEVGYAPKDITYFALSHYHGDHAGNANAFAGSTWLVQKRDRDAMFSEKKTPAQRVLYSALANSRTRVLDGDLDVFGDGTVVIKAAYGHTEGHQVLQVTLAKTGLLILAGDLYHFQEQRGTNRVGPIEFNPEQSAASRAAIEALLKKTGGQLWIEHDAANFRILKHAPAYYE